jgi:hypothetical protein
MRRAVSKTQSTSERAPGPTVALEMPSARILADQAGVIADLEFVMDCCKRLLTELAIPESERDGVVPLALWSSALVTYGRCFTDDPHSGLSLEDVQSLPLQGAVVNFHEWLLGERDRVTGHLADPFEAAKVGASLTATGREARGVEGIAVFSASRVLIDSTGAQQLGGLASELARQTAGKARKQQDSVLSDTQTLDIDHLYQAPVLVPEPAPDANTP